MSECVGGQMNENHNEQIKQVNDSKNGGWGVSNKMGVRG